jgi:hypothetical protein
MIKIIRLGDEFSRQTGFDKEQLTHISMPLIEMAREASSQSDHHKYKVGSATLAITSEGKEIYASGANKIPDDLKEFGYDSHMKIGVGNPTVHGEFPLLYDAPPSRHLFLACNTPLCATCLKSAIMRDADALFIDAKGLPIEAKDRLDKKDENPWSKDFSCYWKALCLPIARAAKIPVYKVDMESGTMNVLVNGKPSSERPKPESRTRIVSMNDIHTLENSPELFLSMGRNRRAVIGVGRDKKTGEEKLIYTQDTMPPGFSYKNNKDWIDRFKEAHYHFPMDPIVRLAMNASKHGMEMQEGRIITNFIPSSGRLIDLNAIGVKNIYITSRHLPPTEDARFAIKHLQELGVIDFSLVKASKGLKQIIGPAYLDYNGYKQYDAG